jgi:hypothetical protein
MQKQKNMKKILKINAVILLFSMLTLTACNKGIDEFGDINIDPNTTPDPITSALLTNVLSGLGGNVWGNTTNVNGGLYSQYMSETQYTDASRYATPTTSWDTYYSGALYDLQNIINYNTDPEKKDDPKVTQNGSNANQIATARILKAYYFKLLTDAWGDLPYFEALKGESSVPFDPQEVVYQDLLKELKEAVAQFDGGLEVKGDIMYGGDIDKWKKFANSLRAILALRMSKANATVGKAEFADAIAAGVIESNADNAVIEYPGGAYNNPIYNYYVITQRFDYAVSKTVTDLMSSMSDPRITLFGHTTKGFPYGLTRADAIAWAGLNPDYANLYEYDATPETMPMFILTAGQVYLARAEAAKLGWTTEIAATMYINGITAELNRWGITGAAVATYLAQPSVALNGVDDLARIGTQRWLAHYPDGNEGWAEWRRTGYPVLTPAPGAGKAIPLRLPYGPTDELYNPTNYSDAAARYSAGGVTNSQDAAVWWDK